MKTIGEVLKSARQNKKITLEKLEFQTKIKKNFLKAIEDEEWLKLPSYTVVSGFVRSIAEALEVSPAFALALLRRDYPPKNIKVTPAQDIETKVFWSPRLTFALGIGVFILIILGYLGLQYIRFMSPPSLEVTKPKEEETLLSTKIEVAGKTDTDTNILVNNQPVIVDQDGNFDTDIQVSATTDKLIIKAVNRAGKETVKEVKIKLDL